MASLPKSGVVFTIPPKALYWFSITHIFHLFASYLCTISTSSKFYQYLLRSKCPPIKSCDPLVINVPCLVGKIQPAWVFAPLSIVVALGLWILTSNAILTWIWNVLYDQLYPTYLMSALCEQQWAFWKLVPLLLALRSYSLTPKFSTNLAW